MGIRIDFSEADELLPNGKYHATVTRFALSDKKGGSGYHYINVDYRVDDGTYKSTVWQALTLSPKGITGTKETLTALGFELPRGEIEVEPADVIGKEVEIVVDQETYEGKLQNRVQSVRLVDAGGWG